MPLPTTNAIQNEAIPLLRSAVPFIDDTTIDPSFRSFARETFTFAARVFSLLYDTDVPIAASISECVDLTVRDAPAAPSTTRVINYNRALRKRPLSKVENIATPPEAYVNRENIDQWLDWFTDPAQTEKFLRSKYGRRADAFLAVAVMTAMGEVATTPIISALTGVAENNTSKHLNDLCVLDVLRRKPSTGGVTWRLSNWTKERVL